MRNAYKILVSQPLCRRTRSEIFPPFYGTRKFLSYIPELAHWLLSQARINQSTASILFKTHFNNILTITPEAWKHSDHVRAVVTR
jgi:hypothetical protein